MTSDEVHFVEYSDDALPAGLRCQVLSFLRVVFPEGFLGANRYRDWITQSKYEPQHLLYVANGLVVSHVEIVRRAIDHAGVRYTAYAPTGVQTFPSFRREGWAGRLVRRAARWISESDADLGLICCHPNDVGFYNRASGWDEIPDARIIVGDTRADAEPTAQSLLATFRTPKAQAGREDFVRTPLWLRDEL